MRGSWIWLRRGSMPPIEHCIEHLDGVIYPLQVASGPLHVGPSHRAWLRAWMDAGRTWWSMDWLTPPGSTAHVKDLCARSRDLGAVGVMGDYEPHAGWRGRVREAVALRLEFAEHRGALDLAITDMANGGIGPATLGAFLAEVDGHRPIGVPQSYDPKGRYLDGYHEMGVSKWRDAGAQRLVLGAGIWLDGENRHRTPGELRRHLEHIPEDVQGVAGWYAKASALDDGDDDRADDLLPVLGEHRAGNSGEFPPHLRETPVEPLRVRLVASLEALAVEAKAGGDREAAHELAHTASRLAR